MAWARNRRRERTRTGLAAIFGLLGILYALVFTVGRSGNGETAFASGRIELLRAADGGGAAPGAGATRMSFAGSLSITSVAGSTPNLFGGSRASRCNAGQLPGALLTEVVLLRDTRVTGVRSGLAPFQAVLERGSAVLVDESGVPRLRCAGLIPLRPPLPASSTPDFVGVAWPGFNPAALTVVVAVTRVDAFSLVNLDGSGLEPIRRAPGERP
jgi:hypothetical protein